MNVDLNAIRARYAASQGDVDCGDSAPSVMASREDVPGLCDEVEQLRQSLAVTGGLYRSAESDVTQIVAAMTELVHHGDLTPSGRRVLERIIGGGGE